MDINVLPNPLDHTDSPVVDTDTGLLVSDINGKEKNVGDGDTDFVQA